MLLQELVPALGRWQGEPEALGGLALALGPVQVPPQALEHLPVRAQELVLGQG